MHPDGHVCSPSIKHLSWITPEAKPAHTITRCKKNMKLYIGCNRYSLRSMINIYVAIYGGLKIDGKLQKVMEAIYFFIVQSAG